MSGWWTAGLATGAVGSIVLAPGLSLLGKRLKLAVLGWYCVVEGMASFPRVSSRNIQR